MIDDKGILQGGEKGRLFGRIRDKFDAMKEKKKEQEKGPKKHHKWDDYRSYVSSLDASMPVGNTAASYRKYAGQLTQEAISPQSSPYANQLSMENVMNMTMNRLKAPNWSAIYPQNPDLPY